jgi:hypothetical protein
MSTTPTALTKLEKSLDPRLLIQTLQLFLEHIEETGIDPIFYVEHPNDNTETVSVIKEYANLSMEHVTKELQQLKPKWDLYDQANDKIARKLIHSILGTALFRDVNARDTRGDMPAAVIWMYAMDQHASLNSDQIEAIKGKMKTLTPIKKPGQDISKFATQEHEMKIELDKLYVYEHTITKKILLNLAQVSVDWFRISVFTLKEQIEPNLQQIKTLAYGQAEYHMMRERLDLEIILTKYELTYKTMVTSGEWAPARNKVDKHTPELMFKF